MAERDGSQQSTGAGVGLVSVIPPNCGFLTADTTHRCFGGAAIVIGLLTYGYQVMRNLGNRLTLMTPSRGFCMELGSALTVLIATRLALPVSTVSGVCHLPISPSALLALEPLC